MNAGASTVLMKVCPVLPSLPATGTLRRSASAVSAGMSAARLGVKLPYGTPSVIAPYAYSIAGLIEAWFSSSPRSNAAMSTRGVMSAGQRSTEARLITTTSCTPLLSL